MPQIPRSSLNYLGYKLSKAPIVPCWRKASGSRVRWWLPFKDRKPMGLIKGLIEIKAYDHQLLQTMRKNWVRALCWTGPMDCGSNAADLLQ